MALLSSRAGPASVERMRNADDVSKIMDENNTSVIVKHRGRVVGLVSPNDMMRIMVKVRRREGGRFVVSDIYRPGFLDSDAHNLDMPFLRSLLSLSGLNAQRVVWSTVPVWKMMTPNPLTATSSMTVVEALQQVRSGGR